MSTAIPNSSPAASPLSACPSGKIPREPELIVTFPVRVPPERGRALDVPPTIPVNLDPSPKKVPLKAGAEMEVVKVAVEPVRPPVRVPPAELK